MGAMWAWQARAMKQAGYRRGLTEEPEVVKVRGAFLEHFSGTQTPNTVQNTAPNTAPDHVVDELHAMKYNP